LRHLLITSSEQAVQMHRHSTVVKKYILIFFETAFSPGGALLCFLPFIFLIYIVWRL
jgi:hypothetical protein